MKVYEVIFNGGNATMVIQKMPKRNAYSIKWNRYKNLTARGNFAQLIEAPDEWTAAEIFAGEPLKFFKVYLDDYDCRTATDGTAPPGREDE